MTGIYEPKPDPDFEWNDARAREVEQAASVPPEVKAALFDLIDRIPRSPRRGPRSGSRVTLLWRAGREGLHVESVPLALLRRAGEDES